MFDVESLIGPRMRDARARQPALDDGTHPRPWRFVSLASPPERSQPDVGEMVMELAERGDVGRHGVVVEPSANDLL